MTDLSDFLAADAVESAFHVTSKKGLFQQLAVIASRHTGIDAKTIAAAIPVWREAITASCWKRPFLLVT